MRAVVPRLYLAIPGARCGLEHGNCIQSKLLKRSLVEQTVPKSEQAELLQKSSSALVACPLSEQPRHANVWGLLLLTCTQRVLTGLCRRAMRRTAATLVLQILQSGNKAGKKLYYCSISLYNYIMITFRRGHSLKQSYNILYPIMLLNN